jgi:glycosyltransferase involved in cell wall biosynthesis
MERAVTVLDAPETPNTPRLRTRPVTPLPDRLAVGRGNALFVDGCCSHPSERITDLHVLVDDVEHPVMAKGQPPPGRLAGSDYWWSIVTFDPVSQPRFARLQLRAHLESGTEVTAPLGVIELRARVGAPDPPAVTSEPTDGELAAAEEPLIAVCMATYQPPLGLFRRQIDSIRAQTHRNWVCVISDDRSDAATVERMREIIGDDPRFYVFPSSRRLGLYLNFERALALAPEEAAFVALSDQDDRWYPQKLQTLRSRLETGAKLAYSDMRIVDANSAVVSDTYWSYRRNNHTNYGSLLVANTITGAASLFRREILDYVLPFPPKLGNNYHDHWIALVAMSLGRVSYVDAPLHDYVQHGGAALGHARANAAHRRGRNRRERLRRRVERLRSLPRERFHLGWRYLYFDLWCPIALTARVAELRCGEVMASGKLRTLKRFQDSRRGLTWLAARSTRPLLGATETLSRERVLLAALAWRRLVEWRTRTQLLRQVHRGSGRAAPPAPAVHPVSVATSGMGTPGANGSGPDWLTPILVDYFTRDGSTLMMRLLSSSPQIAVETAYPYERKYFSYLWRWSRMLERGEWPEELWGPRAFGSLAQEQQTPLVGPLPWLPRDLIESGADEKSMSERCFQLAWSEFSRRAARWTRAQHRNVRMDVFYYAEKHLNTWMVDTAELPDVRVVALLRDPRDIQVSIGAFELTKGKASGEDRDRLLQVVERHRQRLRWIVGLLESGEAPVVSYEDMVRDLPSVARRLEEWLGVELQPGAVESDRVLRRRHMTAGSVEESIGRWKQELDPRVAEMFTDELGPELRALDLDD